MRIFLKVGVLAMVVGGLLAFGGCTSNKSEVRTSEAAGSPQEKVHNDQLNEMSREDAEGASVESDKAEEKEPIVRRRRAGQRVVDQPIRR